MPRVDRTHPAGVSGAARGQAPLVGLPDIEAARERIADVVRRTPTLPAPWPVAGGRPSTDAEDAIWLKCENLQRVSAFKARGACHFVSRLSDRQRAAGLLTYSSGNHAQAVAFAARAVGARARIVMPVDAPAVKVAATRRLGAEVEQVGTTSAERHARAVAIEAETGATMVPPFDHPHIIAGQGTVGLEILEQLSEQAGPGDTPDRPTVLVPIGGGGLLSGVAAAIKGRAPGARVIGVEPEGAPSMLRSIRAGEPVTLDRVETVADGLKPVRPGDLTFRHCVELVDDVVTVSDEAIRAATVWLFERRLVVEPSGAATVAAIMEGVADPRAAGPLVAVLSGGNVHPELLLGWIRDAPSG